MRLHSISAGLMLHARSFSTPSSESCADSYFIVVSRSSPAVPSRETSFPRVPRAGGPGGRLPHAVPGRHVRLPERSSDGGLQHGRPLRLQSVRQHDDERVWVPSIRVRAAVCRAGSCHRSCCCSPTAAAAAAATSSGRVQPSCRTGEWVQPRCRGVCSGSRANAEIGKPAPLPGWGGPLTAAADAAATSAAAGWSWQQSGGPSEWLISRYTCNIWKCIPIKMHACLP